MLELLWSKTLSASSFGRYWKQPIRRPKKDDVNLTDECIFCDSNQCLAGWYAFHNFRGFPKSLRVTRTKTNKPFLRLHKRSLVVKNKVHKYLIGWSLKVEVEDSTINKSKTKTKRKLINQSIAFKMSSMKFIIIKIECINVIYSVAIYCMTWIDDHCLNLL